MSNIKYTITLEIETYKDSVIDSDINALTSCKLLHIQNYFFIVRKVCKEVIDK